MRNSTSSTTWECDFCPAEELLMGGYQNVPPTGWRIIHILPIYVNMALEGEPHKVQVMCAKCFDTRITKTERAE